MTNTLQHVSALDAADPLSGFRERFYIPLVNNAECIYFTGNSLGLQPRSTQDYVLNELEDWANFGVEGHFHARNPWLSYHELFPPLLAPVVGALPEEIVVMNQLTVNLHLLLTTFYRPDAKRFKIICEAKAFPSDVYALESQIRLHGFDVQDALIEVTPGEGQTTISTEAVLAAIEANKDSACLIMLGGVNYYNGQVFDMAAITKAAHKAGMYAGFDLAHAAGNIELHLHDWDVDFACWCSYKYLNSGPGGVSGVYIHQKHATNTSLPRLAGWWGHDKQTRFKMDREFIPIPTAEGWQLSNAPVLSMAAHKASLDIFEEAGMNQLIRKSKEMNRLMITVIREINETLGKPFISNITPDGARGCQTSLLLSHHARDIFDALTAHGIIADWREPNVIRVAPVPLYNTFTDIHNFGKILLHLCQAVN